LNAKNAIHTRDSVSAMHICGILHPFTQRILMMPHLLLQLNARMQMRRLQPTNLHLHQHQQLQIHMLVYIIPVLPIRVIINLTRKGMFVFTLFAPIARIGFLHLKREPRAPAAARNVQVPLRIYIMHRSVSSLVQLKIN
jgi:hypothetical protein